MPSQMLIHEPREEALPAASTERIQIVSVESRIDSISLSKVGPVRTPEASSFDFDVDLNERGRTGGSLCLGYSFSFGKPSSGQICKISGEAVVRFSQFSTEKDFHYLSNDMTNGMAVEIFRKIYESTYLLHEAMDLDAPSPWITQDVSLSSRSQALLR